MAAFIAMVLLLLGVAGVLSGGASVGLTLSYLDGCTEQCERAAVPGSLGVIVLAAGVVCLIVGAARLASRREWRTVAARDRRLRELQLRLYRG